MTEHSPLPWTFETEGADEIIRASDGSEVHRDTDYYPSGLATVDAKLIVQCVNAANTKRATSEWMEPTLMNLRENDWYLVQTNGMEWRDADLFVWKGIAVMMRLKPEIVRGRPIRIARINLPEAT